MRTNDPFPRSTPEAQGIPSPAILAFLGAAEARLGGLHGLVLLRHGHVVTAGWWSPYEAKHPHDLFSLSKSFTSTAVGLAVAEGRLSVDDPVLSFFPEEAPPQPGEHLAAMCVRHLLTMTTGHAEEPSRHMAERQDGNWVRGFMEQPVVHAPGTHFLYNSGASYVLSAIVQQVAGMTALDYLQSRLFAPLGIETPTWATCPRGINVGGWGLSLKTGDIACFGQLYLQQGLWQQGQRILPAAWVEEATTCQVSNAPNENPDWAQGYGYQFWRCRHDAYRGDGAFGQFCLVMPDRDAIVAITSGVRNMQAVLDLVWEHLLPAMGAAPLPADRSAHVKLEHKLADLSLPLSQGATDSPVTERVSGAEYVLEENEQNVRGIAFDFGRGGCTVTVRDDGGEHHFACGSRTWRRGTTTYDGGVERKVAASGVWTAEDTYVIDLCFYETPFCPTITCRFTEDRLTFDVTANVAFGPRERPRLVGRAS